MSSTKPWTRWLVGAAGGAMLALLLVPATRWIVWSQFRAVFRVPHTAGQVRSALVAVVDSSKDPEAIREREQALTAAAARYPDDVGLQMAAALMVPIDNNERYDPAQLPPRARRLEPLWRAHRQSPPLCAAMVRLLCSRGWLGARPERNLDANWLRGAKQPKVDAPPADQVEVFRQVCADGEAADPDNAFFPWMQAVALFAANRDADAIAAIKRASVMTKWRDYVADEARARMRLAQLATGSPGAVAKADISAGILLPHYASMRALARLATAKAVLAERAGKREEGFAIRRAVAHAGGLMRAESTYIIGTMVGSAIETVAGMCPGGEVAAEARRGGPDDNDEGRAASAQALYARYLDSIGHPEEAAWLRAEWAARLKARAAFEGGVDLVWFGPAMPVTRLAAMWAAGMLLLLNAGWLALMGLAAWRASKGKAEAPGTRGGLIVWGLAALGCLLGALLAGGIAASAMLTSDYLVSRNGITYAGWPGLIPAAFLCAMWVRGFCLARRWAWLTAFTGALAITLGAMLATTCALAGHGGVYDMLRMAATLVVPIPANDRVSADTYIQAALCGAALVPALLLLAATVVSLFCRVPMSKGWARAMRGLAIPSVCVILLAYAGLLVQTARTEALCSHAIERITENEGRFLAELSGKEWPGRTP